MPPPFTEELEKLMGKEDIKLKKVIALKPGYAKLHPSDDTEQRIAAGTVFEVPADAESVGVRGGRGRQRGPWFEDVAAEEAPAPKKRKTKDD